MANQIDNQARDLVLRARAGDQNAMGMIASVADSAKRGSKKAQVASEAIARYIDRNPVNKSGQVVRIGAEANAALATLDAITRESKRRADRGRDEGHESTCLLLVTLPMVGDTRVLRAGSAILSNGPLLTPQRVERIRGSLRDPATQQFFLQGVSRSVSIDLDDLDRYARPFVAAGQILGNARLVQLVRCPSTSIANYSEMAAWELGEKSNEPRMLNSCVQPRQLSA